MIPTPPLAAEAEQEEARRQATGQGGTPGMDGVGDGVSAAVDAVADGTLEALVNAAGEALGGTLEVAKASLEAVGGILGALDGL